MKKKKHTIKTQIVIDFKTEKIICTHQAKGRVHDFKLLKKSKLPINSKKKIKLDSGYQGMEKIHPNCELPIKGSKLYPLNKTERKYNLRLSKNKSKSGTCNWKN